MWRASRNQPGENISLGPRPPMEAEAASRRGRIALRGLAAALGVAAIALPAAVLDTGLSSDAADADMGGGLPPVPARIVHKASNNKNSGSVAHTAKSRFKSRSGCTSIRRRANDIYWGKACASDGDQYEKVGDGHIEKGWVYSTIAVGGIYKCGFVREGTLPERSLNQDAVTKCEEYYDPLVNQRDVFLQDINCPEIKPGLEGCRSGTRSSPVRKISGIKKTILWGNFATNEPGPLNVFGTGKGGFSMKLPNKIGKLLSYRAEVSQGSQDGKAIVVRDIKNTPAFDWGFTPSQHVAQNDRSGGVPTKVAQ